MLIWMTTEAVHIYHYTWCIVIPRHVREPAPTLKNKIGGAAAHDTMFVWGQFTHVH